MKLTALVAKLRRIADLYEDEKTDLEVYSEGDGIITVEVDKHTYINIKLCDK